MIVKARWLLLGPAAMSDLDQKRRLESPPYGSADRTGATFSRVSFSAAQTWNWTPRHVGLFGNIHVSKLTASGSRWPALCCRETSTPLGETLIALGGWICRRP
jgi:hypothetical protein